MKNVAIVAPQFPPCNLAAVHRNRFLAAHLTEFGWKPTVLTVRSEFYEETADPELERLLPAGIRVIRTGAFGVRPLRLVGDISLRCFLWHWIELRKLAQARQIDFVFISLFPAYTTLLGRLIRAEFGTPYGIDFQDPWVEYRSPKEPVLSKRGLSRTLARLLEPAAVAECSLLSSVSASYVEGVISRNPRLRGVPAVFEPIGFEASDHESEAAHRRAYLFDGDKFNIVYAGAYLPESEPVWKMIFDALRTCRDSSPELFSRVRINCIGTGAKDAAEPLARIARRCGVADAVVEHPGRIPYTDVLSHLHAADATLIAGSVERHYTASKLFQAILAKKPIFALLNKESSGIALLSRAGVRDIVALNADALETQTAEVARALTRLVETPPPPPDASTIERYSARSIAEAFAKGFDAAIEYAKRSGR